MKVFRHVALCIFCVVSHLLMCSVYIYIGTDKQMISAAILLTLGGMGYYINENQAASQNLEDDEREQDALNVLDGTPSDIPSGENIYHNRRSEKVFADELEKSTARHKEAMRGNYLYRNYPETKWDRKHYRKSSQFIQLEKDIQNPHEMTTTEKPMSQLDQLRKTKRIESFPLQQMTDIASETSFNDQRNNIPNPGFRQIGCAINDTPIYQTVYPDGKNVTVCGGKAHNNMIPFFGGSVKQNTNENANRVKLEHFTGTSPVYAHKQETGRFFPTIKDQFAVLGGLPVGSNRDDSRYVTPITRQNTLPFAQERVPPGLNLNANDMTTTIGFHDPYRPMGQGHFKPVNELRVNPKITYYATNAGEGYYIPKGTKSVPVYSRKPWKDLSFSNFDPKNPAYREMLHTGAQVDKAEILDPKTIVLRNVQRTSDTPNVGPAQFVDPEKKTYFFDKAKTTIKQETEVNIHDRINPKDENRRNQTYAFDCFRPTIKQETEVNIYDRINPKDENRRNTSYYFDTAKETIKEQTEDNIHCTINPKDENRRNTSYYFDTAKETIKEQTEDNIYAGKVGIEGTDTQFKPQDISAYANASINALKELAIAKNRPPTTCNVAMIPEKEKQGDYQVFRRQQFDTYPLTKHVEPTAPINATKHLVGQQTQFKPEYTKDFIQQSQRVDPIFNEQFRHNPYTQSLNSWQVPQNPAFPVIRDQCMGKEFCQQTDQS